jgi:hypothetical protein
MKHPYTPPTLTPLGTIGVAHTWRCPFGHSITVSEQPTDRELDAMVHALARGCDVRVKVDGKERRCGAAVAHV